MARRTTSRSRTRDDDYDPTPDESGAIGRYDDDEEDEAPRRGRSRRSHEDDEDERPARRGRSSRRDEDDEDDAPRARGRRSRSRDDDEEDESPRRSRGRGRSDDDDRPKRPTGKVGRGWGAVEKMKVGEYTNRWDVPEKPTLIKFLEDAPFAVYSEHFLEELPKGQRKSFICPASLEDSEDDCPLCDELGDVPSPYAAFNVLDLADPDNPKVVFLRAPGGLAKKIKEIAQEKRSKPLNRIDVYFEISRKKEAGARYQFALVKARDLEEDWDVVPFEEDELAEFEKDLIDQDAIITLDTRSKLKQIVNEIDG